MDKTVTIYHVLSHIPENVLYLTHKDKDGKESVDQVPIISGYIFFKDFAKLLIKNTEIYTYAFNLLTEDVSICHYLQDNNINIDELVIYADGTTEYLKSDIKNAVVIKRNEEKFKNILHKEYPFNITDFVNEAAYKIAMHSADTAMANITAKALERFESEIYTNEYDIIKSFEKRFLYIGKIYCIMTKNADGTVQLDSNIKTLKKIKEELLHLKTKELFVADDKDKIINKEGDYDYTFVTTSNFGIYRDKDGYHINSLTVSPEKVSNF